MALHTWSSQKAKLFLSSYTILFAVLAIRFNTTTLEVGSVVLTALGLLFTLELLRAERRKSPGSFTFVQSADAGPEVAGYLASYLLPFVTVSEPTGRDVVGYLAFLLVMFVVFVQSDMLQANPLLYLLGRRLVRARTADGWEAYVLTTSPLPLDVPVQATTLANRVLVRTTARE